MKNLNISEIALFGGSFNPIHCAHIDIAKTVLNVCQLKKIIFLPALQSPFKSLLDSKMNIQKLNMLKIALKNFPKFEIDDIEYHLQAPSYTLITILELKKKYNIDKNQKLNWILGSDSFLNIEKWYRSDILKTQLNFLIISRPNSKIDIQKVKSLKERGYEFRFIEMKESNLSSNLIRNKIISQESIDGLVPKEVKEYIYDNKLYGF